MKKATEVVRGKIENLKRVTTRTENTMVTFTVGGAPCKAFGKGAEMMIRWMQHDPNSVGQFEGYFDRRSERFGREFVAAHGRLIETQRMDDADRSVMPAPGVCVPGATSAAASSTSTEPVPAEEPTGLKTEIAAREPFVPVSQMPPARTPWTADDFAPVKGVTFEDLENQYKSQKMEHEMDGANQRILKA